MPPGEHLADLAASPSRAVSWQTSGGPTDGRLHSRYQERESTRRAPIRGLPPLRDANSPRGGPLPRATEPELPYRLGDLVLLESRAGSAGDVQVTAHRYRDGAGHRVVVYGADRAVPEALGAEVHPGGGDLRCRGRRPGPLLRLPLLRAALGGLRYLLTSFPGLEKLVNDIGGLPVSIPYAMADEASGAFFEEGVRKLSGTEALAFARNRKDTPNGDFSRSENQGSLLVAALDKLRSKYAKNPAAIFEWIAVGLANVQTDLPFDEVFDLMLTAVQIDPGAVQSLVAPGGITNSGGVSAVALGEEANAIFADVRDDAILGG